MAANGGIYHPHRVGRIVLMKVQLEGDAKLSEGEET
jgi:hypothetical protein